MTKVVVYHAGYGCDTGCCGHIVELGDTQAKFTFEHPDDTELTTDTKQWVIDIVTKEFGAEHVSDIDWNDVIVSDW